MIFHLTDERREDIVRLYFKNVEVNRGLVDSNSHIQALLFMAGPELEKYMVLLWDDAPKEPGTEVGWGKSNALIKRHVTENWLCVWAACYEACEGRPG